LQHYAQVFFELRQHKGVTLDNALDVMMDVSYFGTMMVYQGDADGMVSGRCIQRSTPFARLCNL
jgi:phosphate acetyltransferase